MARTEVRIYSIADEIAGLKEKNTQFSAEIETLESITTRPFSQEDLEAVQASMDTLTNIQRRMHLLRIAAYQSQRRHNNG